MGGAIANRKHSRRPGGAVAPTTTPVSRSGEVEGGARRGARMTTGRQLESADPPGVERVGTLYIC